MQTVKSCEDIERRRGRLPTPAFLCKWIRARASIPRHADRVD